MTIQVINPAILLGLSTDTKPTTRPANTIFIETDTGLFYKYNGSSWVFFQGMTGPVRQKKIGGYTATSSVNGWGIFGSMTNTGTFAANQFDNTNGTYAKMSTTSTINSASTHKYSAFITIRAFNPVLAVKFKNATSATSNILYTGFKASSGDPTGGTTDPLASNSGIMLVQRAADTQYQICTNSGGANSTFTSTGVNVDTTTVNTIVFRADDANTKWQWSLNGSAWTDVTTTIPASTTQLVYMSGIQTTEAVIHDLWLYGVDISSDK